MKAVVGVVLIYLAVSTSSVSVADQSSGFDCVVTPSQTVSLGSPVPGQIAEMLVDRSSHVTTGEIVASLESRLETANLKLANHRAEIDTELSLRKAAFETDRLTERRLSSLAASNAASQHEKDRALRDAKLSGLRVLQARDDLEILKLEQSRAAIALDRRSIRSPIDGVVVARLHEAGEYIDSQPLLKIAKLDPLYVEAILPMRIFGEVYPGMTARVMPEHQEGEALDATVDVVDPMGDAGSGTFGARLILPNPDGEIPAGVKCRINLLSDQSTLVN